jgi:hypothetical protein
MSNKNPFEIRLEILKMAKEYLETQYNTNLAFAQEVFAKALESGQVMQDNFQSFIPKSYSIEDIMKKSQELYGFICNTNISTAEEPVEKNKK